VALRLANAERHVGLDPYGHRLPEADKALVTAAEQHAAQYGVSRLIAPSLAPNADAVSFYSRAGYGPHGILLSKEVAAGGGAGDR
jgi:hypothetical protein